MSPIDADEMANNVDSDQIAPEAKHCVDPDQETGLL